MRSTPVMRKSLWSTMALSTIPPTWCGPLPRKMSRLGGRKPLGQTEHECKARLGRRGSQLGRQLVDQAASNDRHPLQAVRARRQRSDVCHRCPLAIGTAEWSLGECGQLRPATGPDLMRVECEAIPGSARADDRRRAPISVPLNDVGFHESIVFSTTSIARSRRLGRGEGIAARQVSSKQRWLGSSSTVSNAGRYWVIPSSVRAPMKKANRGKLKLKGPSAHRLCNSTGSPPLR